MNHLPACIFEVNEIGNKEFSWSGIKIQNCVRESQYLSISKYLISISISSYKYNFKNYLLSKDDSLAFSLLLVHKTGTVDKRGTKKSRQEHNCAL